MFALIAFDALEGSEAKAVLAAITLTVLVSVIAHGLSAAPLSRRYGEQVAAIANGKPELTAVPTLATRPQTSTRRAARIAVPELED